MFQEWKVRKMERDPQKKMRRGSLGRRSRELCWSENCEGSASRKRRHDPCRWICQGIMDDLDKSHADRVLDMKVRANVQKIILLETHQGEKCCWWMARNTSNTTIFLLPHCTSFNVMNMWLLQ
jgi:hypothetical protein